MVPSPTGRRCACGGQLFIGDARGPDTQPHCTNPSCFMNRGHHIDDLLAGLKDGVEPGGVQSTVCGDTPATPASGEQLELSL
jgi:hypothetical protein